MAPSPSPPKGCSSTGGASAWCQNFRKNWGQNFRNPHLVQRIRAGYEDETPGGGRRWIVEYPASIEWHDCTLARRPGHEGEPTFKTLIELPTFSIVAPSNGATHQTGRPYVRLSGGFNTIARYTVDERDALIQLACSFDQMPRREQHAPVTHKATTAGRDLRPGNACQWQPKTAHLWQPKTAHFWGGRLGRSGHSPGDARRACWAGRRERSDRSPGQHAPRRCGAGGHVATPSRCSSDAVLSQC